VDVDLHPKLTRRLHLILTHHWFELFIAIKKLYINTWVRIHSKKTRVIGSILDATLHDELKTLNLPVRVMIKLKNPILPAEMANFKSSH
jgi:hypothetical protein